MRLPQTPPEVLPVLQSRTTQFLDILSQEEYRHFAQECHKKHWHWDRLRFIARHHGLDPELAWAMIGPQRAAMYRNCPGLTDKAGQPLRFVATDEVRRDMMMIDQRLAGRIEFMGGRLSSAEGERAVHASLQEEAITSSMLEGAATTRRDAKEMLRTRRAPQNRGEQMVLNNWKGIEFIRQHQETPLTPDFVIELQAILTHDTLERPDEVGRLRTPEDYVVVEDQRTSEVIHTPPSADELPARLAAYCEFANDTDIASGDFIHPVTRAIALHYQMGYDHPFCDGNGRTARTLFYWSMLNQGYWLFEYLPISRLIYSGPAKYVAAFLYSETDTADLTHFLLYHLKIIRRAIDDLEKYIYTQRDKAREMSKHKRPIELDDRQWRVLQHMRTNPATPISTQEYQRLAKVSYGTSRTDLMDMEARGLLRRAKISRKYVYYPRLPKP